MKSTTPERVVRFFHETFLSPPRALIRIVRAQRPWHSVPPPTSPLSCRKSYVHASAPGPRGDYGDSLAAPVNHSVLRDQEGDGRNEDGSLGAKRAEDSEREEDGDHGGESGSMERTARACPRMTERGRSEPKRLARVPRVIQWLQYRAAAGQGSMWLRRGGVSSPVRLFTSATRRASDS